MIPRQRIGVNDTSPPPSRDPLPQPDAPVLIGTAIDVVMARILCGLRVEPRPAPARPDNMPDAMASLGRWLGGNF